MPRRDLEHLLRPATAGVGLQVMGVEPDAAQLVFSSLPEGPAELRVNGRTMTWQHHGGPGCVVVDDLAPATTYHAELRGPGGSAAAATATIRTDPGPRGDELFRFATVSDLHLGRGEKPYRGPTATPMSGDARASHQDLLADDRATRCARAALAEAVAWGAQLIVVKGDLCERTYDWTWDLAAALLREVPVPVLVLPGNHDTSVERHFEPEHGAAERGIELTRGVDHHDVDGLRIVMADSTVPSSGWGDVARHGDEVAQLAAEADGGVFVATHHQPQRFSVPLYWPHGIPGPNATAFARAVRAANPAVLTSSGHTHRNRVRRVAGMPWSEVAATNHFPGVWAGYRVHEGGLHQTVRRIAEPDTLDWTERTRRMLGGVWALWSAGELSDRSFTLDW